MKKMIFAPVLLAATLFTNCTGMESFKSDLRSTTANNIFVASTDGDGPNNPTIPPFSGGPVPFSVSVSTFCSSSGAQATKGDIVDAASITGHVLNAANMEVCTITDPNLRANIINLRKITITDLQASCPNLGSGTYSLSLTAPNSLDLLFGESDDAVFNDRSNLYASGTLPMYTFSLSVSASGVRTVQGEQQNGAPLVPTVMYETNPQSLAITSGGTGDCTAAASPLLLHLSNAPIELSAPLSGVMFDIFGRNIYPAHAKSLISWFSPQDAEGNYFLVLPNAGQVNGVDQMFGNNTYGPDHQFAANGFVALAKWDSNYDGVIDSRDPIYSLLQLWSDANGDGVAQPSELHSLASLGVVSLGLTYDGSYSETDKYGNQIKYKAIVTTVDGQEHVMYDIWFRPVK